ncbi:hypothetical protein LN042_29280 [Kitasatospora sp. RB6PN24]|uniref:hypothetical protein n=1 Tax=Kitasatospora humi TaxID=2893891 RepID=UPI001E3C70FF|nr:hypothetical protein [Kitasatospora humi]MCC9311109.1 hypothetical protein [Kitasatospora humi]
MTTLDSTKPVPSYTGWGDLPAHLVTKTQLADLDLPRRPGGPVRARITAKGPSGRRGTFDLYDIRESVPSSATTSQLAAAAARRTPGTRVCEQCGAHPETPCAQVDGRLLCRTCAHIHQLRRAQKQATAQATQARERAARLLADQRLAVLAVTYTHRPADPATGKARPPVAAHITALDRTGATLYDRTLRLTGPRTPGAPADAVAPGPAIADLGDRLATRTVLLWDDELTPLHDALRRLKVQHEPILPTDHQRVQHLNTTVTRWRADVDPATGHHRIPTPPGTANRLLYLLNQVATAEPVHHLGELRPAP